MEIKEINRKKFSPASESDRAKSKELMVKMRKEGDKMIRGMFEFVDAQGGWIDFSYRFFPGEPIRTVKIMHGEVCDVPMILAKHLNNVYRKVRMPIGNLDERGGFRFTKISRTKFTPMDMMAEEAFGMAV